MPVNGWNIPPANNRRVRLPPPVFYLLRGRSTISDIERSMEFAPMSEIVVHHKRIFIFRSCRKRPGIMAKIRVGPPVPLPIFIPARHSPP
jgi:hypothetical protein